MADLKKGVENDTFGFVIGPGFKVLGGTPPPRFHGSISPEK